MSGRRILPALVLLLAQGCDGVDPPDAAPPAGAATTAAAPASAPPVQPVEAPPVNPEAEVIADAAAPSPLEIPLSNGPPENFGQLHPSLPPPAADELTVHALAGFEVVAVHARPDLASPRLGYLRIGSRTMVTPKLADQGSGCDKGFHALPAGGFACASKGLIVDPDKPPYMYRPPPPPRIDAPIPYDYGVVAADGTPMWWRIPDDEEVMLAGQKYRAIVAAQEAADAAANPTPKPSTTRKPASDDPATAPAKPDATATPDTIPPPDTAATPAEPAPLPTLEDLEAPPPPVELSAEEKAEIARREAAARKRAEARKKQQAEQERALARKRARLPLNSQTPFMEQGFVVTLGEKIREGGHAWWKTTRGGFIPANRAYHKQTRDFHGGAIPPDARAAFGFVMAEAAAASVRSDKGTLKWKRKLAEREFLTFSEEVEVGGRPYLVTADGLFVRKADLRLAQIQPRPAEVQPWERWIDVDLALQLLVAYEGDIPVYATLVSSGKKGTEEESFVTPKGKFRITAKHISSSMDGNTASDGRYSIQDVPWAMFFSGNYALHGAFWHSAFGNRRSHGCVNLGPTDARWLFLWTTPFVPEGWHGVNAHDGAPGSMVVIH